ncbi:MAG: hypothetical protein QNK23_16845 [Crocinitomicaceae bacterium]|nr:hypothetical protein [Crocinitomicaceae bacterium]
MFPLLLGNSLLLNGAWMSMDTVYNLGFIVGNLSVLTLYLSLKHGQVINITKGFFSLGDILFLLALTPLFSFSIYIFFFTFGTFLVLFIHGAVNMVWSQKTIPFAGYMGIPALICWTQKTDFIQLLGTVYG